MSVNWWVAMDSTDSRIGPHERLVYAVLVRHANGTGVCWPSWMRIQQHSGLSHMSVGRALNNLKESGIIISGKHGKQGVFYRLPINNELQAQTSTTEIPVQIQTSTTEIPVTHEPVPTGDQYPCGTSIPVVLDQYPCGTDTSIPVVLDQYPCGTRTTKGTTKGRTTPRTTPSLVPTGADDPNFVSFWKNYPHPGQRSHRIASYEEWKRLMAAKIPIARIAVHLKAAKASRDWQEDDGKYVPAAERWLKKTDFADEPVKVGGNGQVHPSRVAKPETDFERKEREYQEQQRKMVTA